MKENGPPKSFIFMFFSLSAVKNNENGPPKWCFFFPGWRGVFSPVGVYVFPVSVSFFLVGVFSFPVGVFSFPNSVFLPDLVCF